MIPKLTRLLLLAALPFTAAGADDPAAEIRELVPPAAAALAEFHGTLPGALPRKLHVIYWTPKDREPQPQWRERLSRVMETTADFYQRELQRLGFTARRLPLDHAADGLLNIHLVRGKNDYAHYKTESGHPIRQECLPALTAAGIHIERETIVIFCNMSVWDPEKRTMRQNSPYYASGNATRGTAWQVDSALLDPTLLRETAPPLHDGQYGRISAGRYNSIFVGGVIHELGHALGLPHNRERPAEAALWGTALMGSGNRTFGEDLRGEGKGSFLTLAHGLRLASHPFFTGSDKALDEKPSATFTELAVQAHGTTIDLTGRITGTPRTYAIAGYSDPAGGGDYDATTATALPDAEGRFRLRFTALQPGKAGALNLVACHVNGHTTRLFGLGYTVTPDGVPDVTSLTASLLLAPIAEKLIRPDTDAAALASLPPAETSPGAKLARAIATRLAQPAAAPENPPAQIPSDTRQISLTDTRATAQSVGWGSPIADRLPQPPYVLAAGSQLFQRGLYAHAPARHAYALGGKWAHLRGTCGLADGQDGKVLFILKADGRELWRSHPVQAGELTRYDIALDKAQELELLVEDAGNGPNSDWGLWLDPVLCR